MQRTVDQHVLTRSRQELTLAWAGQSYFNIGGSAVLGRAHIGVLILDESMLKCADLRYVIQQLFTTPIQKRNQ